MSARNTPGTTRVPMRAPRRTWSLLTEKFGRFYRTSKSAWLRVLYVCPLRGDESPHGFAVFLFTNITNYITLSSFKSIDKKKNGFQGFLCPVPKQMRLRRSHPLLPKGLIQNVFWTATVHIIESWHPRITIPHPHSSTCP